MAIHPVNDQMKVKVDTDAFNFGGEGTEGTETGVVVEVPDGLISFGMHSFAFEDSLMNEEILDELVKYYSFFVGKRIYWESYQDRGRRIKDGEGEFVFLKMADVIAFADDKDEEGYVVDDNRSGKFSL